MSTFEYRTFSRIIQLSKCIWRIEDYQKNIVLQILRGCALEQTIHCALKQQIKNKLRHLLMVFVIRSVGEENASEKFTVFDRTVTNC